MGFASWRIGQPPYKQRWNLSGDSAAPTLSLAVWTFETPQQCLIDFNSFVDTGEEG